MKLKSFIIIEWKIKILLLGLESNETHADIALKYMKENEIDRMQLLLGGIYSIQDDAIIVTDDSMISSSLTDEEICQLFREEFPGYEVVFEGALFGGSRIRKGNGVILINDQEGIRYVGNISMGSSFRF
ncbi:MAG: hypothetical protein HYW78_00525 [Parcubacteria group bacterium]|nr:hypothetical protein [Parcubacteria group bacterium]